MFPQWDAQDFADEGLPMPSEKVQDAARRIVAEMVAAGNQPTRVVPDTDGCVSIEIVDEAGDMFDMIRVADDVITKYRFLHGKVVSTYSDPTK